MIALVGVALLTVVVVLLTRDELVPENTPRVTAPDCRRVSRQCPEALPPIVLDAQWAEPGLQFTFAPPGGGARPAIEAGTAINVAWEEGGLVGRSQQAILAIVPRGAAFPEDRLVWVIRYDGPCEAPPSPPFERQPNCGVEPHFTMLDAGTGEVLLTWTR